MSTARILTELQRALTAPDPLDRLRALTALRGELDAYERELARRALEGGESFAAVARELGISRQAAHRRYRALTTSAAPVITPRMRRLLQLARQEAARAGADCVELEHVTAVLAGRGRPATALTGPGPTRIGPRLRAALARLEAPVDVEDLCAAETLSPR